MFSTRTEKMAAAALGAIVLGTWGFDAFSEYILSPLDDQQSTITRLQQQIVDAEFEVKLNDRAMREVRELTADGLPAEPLAATAEFQKWLMITAVQCGLGEVNLNPGRAIEEPDIGFRIPFSMTCTGTTADLVKLLSHLRGGGILNRISQIAIAPGRDDSQQNIGINLEVAALRHSPSVRLSNPNSAVPPTDTELRLEQLLTQRNLFSRSAMPVAPRPAATPDSFPAPDPETLSKMAAAEAPKESYVLVACVLNGRQKEAWLVDPRTQTDMVLKEDQSIDIGQIPSSGGHPGRLQVQQINSDHILVAIDDHPPVQLGLGDSLNDTLNRPR